MSDFVFCPLYMTSRQSKGKTLEKYISCSFCITLTNFSRHYIQYLGIGPLFGVFEETNLPQKVWDERLLVCS